MADEIFFELVREKRHFFFEASANTAVAEIKEQLASVSGLSAADVSLLWKEGDNQWTKFDSVKSLGENGLTKDNAAAQKPAYLAILLGGETDAVVTAVSVPPELPDSMRQQS